MEAKYITNGTSAQLKEGTMAEGNETDQASQNRTEENVDIHDLVTFNKHAELDYDALLDDNYDFLTKIDLDSDDCSIPYSYTSCENGNDHKHIGCDTTDTIERICELKIDNDEERNMHAISMVNKDYASLESLVNGHNIDINHVFGLETYIECQYQGWRLVHYLCKDGDLDGLETVVTRGADPTAKTCDGDTGLHICCRYGHPHIVNYLLNIDNPLKDAKNNKGLSPLLEALCNCPRYDKETIYLETVKMLLEAGCNVNHVSDTYKSPLHVAARKWHNAILIRLLIEAGADVNAVVLGSTPLIEAVKRDVKARINTEAVKFLIQAGASVNFRDQRGRSPLCYVARYSRLEKKLLNCFLQAGVDRDLDCYKGLDLHLMRASLDKNLYMVKCLRCYEIDDKEHRKSLEGSPLCMAVQYGYDKMVKFFLENGEDPNSKTSDGQSALQIAVQRNATTTADLLIAYGAKLTDTAYFGGTPLLCVAVEYMCEEMTVLLLDKGADINDKSSSGLTAIHYAVYASVFGQNLSITKLLLQRNCDITSPPNLIHKAIDYGEETVIKLLCEAGCPIPQPFAKLNERIMALGFEKKTIYSDWLYNFCHNPRTLLHICIMNIRKYHGPRLFHFLNTLTDQKVIPMSMTDMILLTDLLM